LKRQLQTCKCSCLCSSVRCFEIAFQKHYWSEVCSGLFQWQNHNLSAVGLPLQR
jgi:hypothetical protein